ncbi:MAG TPA: hydantoinase/oxoprolinase family protein [Armatimonadetes bacterium]|nr:hydantoinase/oxoprolinase family protein [Armatimonadota bacterium]
MGIRVGIDIGGTFTDIVAADSETGELWMRKVPSTPSNLACGAAAALMAISREVGLEDIALLSHATTVGTNALLEGKGARTALLTTEGFRDLLEIARQQRPSLYDLRARKPRPLVPRVLRREVRERVRYDGSVLRPLDREALRRELDFLRGQAVEAVAICFLHSYANPEHERLARDLAAEFLPGVYITASSDILPRFREYERLSTTVVNAYLGPLMSRYLAELSGLVEAAGVRTAFHIMQSNGGTVPLAVARRIPASTVLSGPAAGAAAAAHLCAELNLERAISLDMGGTSTDVCRIENGLPAVASGRRVAGYVVELPGVDVRCLGAGGGSILSLDRAGLPCVGPRSAGADPGPACYGQGGKLPTLTDAFLLLGRLGVSGLLGGELPLDLEAARTAMASELADPLGISVEEAAWGAVALAVANVRRAMDGLTVAAGRDPRDFVLLAAGGAGPLLACELAAELGIRRVVVPLMPGNFSAWGLLASDLRRDWVETHLLSATVEHLPQLARSFASLERQAEKWLEGCEVPPSRRVLLRCVAVRYLGQDYELDVEVPPGEIKGETLHAVLRAFHAAHEQRYGYALPEWPVEFVNLSVTAIGQLGPGRAPRLGRGEGDVRRARTGTRPVFVSLRDGFQPCPIYARDRLGEGDVVPGPAIIEQYDSTTYVPPGYQARVDSGGNLHATGASTS